MANLRLILNKSTTIPHFEGTPFSPDDIKRKLDELTSDFVNDFNNLESDQTQNYKIFSYEVDDSARKVPNHIKIYYDNIGTHAKKLSWLLKTQRGLLGEMYPENSDDLVNIDKWVSDLEKIEAFQDDYKERVKNILRNIPIESFKKLVPANEKLNLMSIMLSGRFRT